MAVALNHRWLPVVLPAWLLILSVAAAQNPLQSSTKPLPDPQAFLEQVRTRLQSDRTLLSQYTYLEKQIELERDGSGRLVGQTVRIYEVYPSLEPGEVYRRHISTNGVPVSAEQLAKADEKHRKKLLEQMQQLAREGASASERWQRHLAEQRQKEQARAQEIFEVYNFRLVGRETVDGHSALVFELTPRPTARTISKQGKLMKKLRGHAVISENDYELMRLELEAIDDITMVGGLVGRVHKGLKVFLRRQKINDAWLPAEARVTGSGRLMLVKKLHLDLVREYSDYRKFSVETATTSSMPD